jgi:hypothetical protein
MQCLPNLACDLGNGLLQGENCSSISLPGLGKANADFALEIHFAPGSPDPAPVFRSMSQLIETFQRFHRELVQTMDVHIEPVMLLEDVESGSVRSWLRELLNATDDTGLT